MISTKFVSTFSTGLSMLDNINMYINGNKVSVPENITILEASKIAGAPKIPTLCNQERLHNVEQSKYEQNGGWSPNGLHEGICRVCLVQQEFDDYVKYVPACSTKVYEGQKIWTNTPEVRETVRAMLKLQLSGHPLVCPTCSSNHHCEFQDLLEQYDVSEKDIPLAVRKKMLEEEAKQHESNPAAEWFGTKYTKNNNSIILDEEKCIKCTRCIRQCSEIQGMNVLSMVNRGAHEHIAIGVTDSEEDYLNTQLDCISCAQCTYVCPTGALSLVDNSQDVFELLRNKKNNGKIFVAQTAPATRITIAEAFGKQPGAYSDKLMVAGLKDMGFDYVFDTLFTADLTIMEEGSELLDRVKKGGPFPMFTSCCPAWVNLVEKKHPEYLENLSSCRSPQGMLSSLIKYYWAEKKGVKPEDIVLVSIMPCGAKKDEIKRPQLNEEFKETDFVLSARELGILFRKGGITDLLDYEPVEYDSPLGESTGAALIFGVTGGVMEAALRTAYEIGLNKKLPDVNFEQVRGFETLKKATIDFGGLPLKVAVCHTSGEALRFLEHIKKTGEVFHFIEVMACYGGCIGGGGTPKINTSFKKNLQKRFENTYDLDEKYTIRKSHENPDIIKLYEEYLEKPLSHKSHHLLHTHYKDRKKE